MKTCSLLTLLIAVVLYTGCTDRLVGPSLDPQDDTSGESMAKRGPSKRFADLSLQVSVEQMGDHRNKILPEDTLYFTVEVHNDGPARTSGVEVSWGYDDSLLVILSAVASTQNSQCRICSYDDSLGVWIVGHLPRDSTASLVLVARALAPGRSISTAEVISSHLPDIDSVPGDGDPRQDDQDSVRITVHRDRRR